MGSVETFFEHRPHLASIAYRMLGSAADAEDVVQEAWLRWQKTSEDEVLDPKSWLSVATTRLCLDKWKSLRNQRLAYTGTWLPEPVVTERPIDRESISLAFLVLLEKLTPAERAVFLLHNVFDYTHAEVAGALGISEDAARQTFHRAKDHVAAGRPRFVAKREDHERLLRAFGAAVAEGDAAALMKLLAENATASADSGGKVRGAADRLLIGREDITRFLAALRAKSPNARFVFDVQEINGSLALVARSKLRALSVVTIETDGAEIVAVHAVVNPDKLALLTIN